MNQSSTAGHGSTNGHSTRASSAGRAEREGAVRSLDDLGAKRGEELERLYRAGTVPADLREVAGTPRGRMLAVRGLERVWPLSSLVQRFAAAKRLFPWEGKSFGAESQAAGTGINRIHLGPLRMTWFPFATRVEPSVVDGAPCIYLDYAQPGNPWFIAKIRDEIREVAPGLYLGPAMWKDGRGGAKHVLWFAVDFRAS